MKVLVADKLPGSRLEAIRSLGLELEYEPGLKAEDLPGRLAGVNVLVVRSTRVTAEAISASRDLSLIIRAGAGVNTIDCAAASERGIYVANCPGKNAVAVAELTIGLICALDRRIPDNVIDLRNGVWNKSEYSKARGLFGRTLGVVGLGRIGREVVHRAKAFGMRVLGWSRSLTPQRADELGIDHASRLEDLVAQADIVTIHLAETPQTRGLFSAEMISRMKPGAYLINTARAGIVDEEALARAVEAGHIRAAVDVYSDEPEAKSGNYRVRLGGVPGIYGTHHIGASTEQAQEAVADEVVRILRTYLNTGRVLNWVNRCARTPAKWQLVVRHYDRPGVLANVLAELKAANINAQEISNVIFEGAKAACCTIQLDSQPSPGTIQAIRSRSNEIIGVELIELAD